MNGLALFASDHPLLVLAAVTMLLLVLLLLRRVVGWLLRFLLRSGVGLAALFAVSKLGVPLGVNLVNAMALGLLGLPGLGLLLALQRFVLP